MPSVYRNEGNSTICPLSDNRGRTAFPLLLNYLLSVNRVLNRLPLFLFLVGMLSASVHGAQGDAATSRENARERVSNMAPRLGKDVNRVDSSALRSSSAIPHITADTESASRSTNEIERTEPAAKSSTTALPNTMNGLNDKRPLGIGDTISLNIVEDESAPRSITVTASGEIDAPYIGRVPAEGKSCKDLAYYLKRELEKMYYYQATVIIGLDSAGAGGRTVSRGTIYVQGQVKSPGPQEIPLGEPYTVGKAILRAGGWGAYANRKKVKLVKGAVSGKDPAKPLVIDVSEIIDKGHWEKDVEVGPNDSITVPERMFNLF